MNLVPGVNGQKSPSKEVLERRDISTSTGATNSEVQLRGTIESQDVAETQLCS